MPELHIGTSGWHYDGWRGSFYPEDLSKDEWLTFYSEKFDTVEVNSTFYRQIKSSTFKKWLSETPKDFTFSIKGNRYITHIKRIQKCRDAVSNFFRNANPFIKKVGSKRVVLWQLPPSLKKDLERFEYFLGLLPKEFKHAFEFRHESWKRKDLLKVLKDQDEKEVAVVMQDWKGWPIFKEPIGDFVYIRFHGRKKLYTSNYKKDELEEWAGKMRKWSKDGLSIFAYFNNDALGYAPKNASILKDMLK